VHAVISCIHGNLPALEAVLDHIRGQRIDRIICLGDAIGYGPWPVECLDLVRARCEVVLCGNHEVAVLTQAFGFHAHARDAIDRTREMLAPGVPEECGRKERWEYLRGLGDRFLEDGVLYVHGSPRDPVIECVEETDTLEDAQSQCSKLRSIFALVDRACFVGHSHNPGIITGGFRFVRPEELPEATYRLPEADKALVNVGSVGQPRDGDPRACYATLDGCTVRFHRVPYDVDRLLNGMSRLDPDGPHDAMSGARLGPSAPPKEGRDHKCPPPPEGRQADSDGG
jgi:diadenosine tetraphosphatase ApaH/serine/threonine PP2A family protein phosphatase